MLPANQRAGFGDLPLNSHSHFNFNPAHQFPFPFPDQRSSFRSPDPNRAEQEEEEEDEWAVYTSRNEVNKVGNGNGRGGSQVTPPQNGRQEEQEGEEDWGLFSSFTAATTADQGCTSNSQTSPSLVKTTLVQEQQEEEEEEEWGTFVSTPIAPQAINTNGSKASRTSDFNDVYQAKLGRVNLHVQAIQDEDEWGEFVSSPVAAAGTGTARTDVTDGTNGSSASASVKWEKPKGPIPLSFFGGEEEEESAQEETEIETETVPALRPVSVSVPHSDSFPYVSPSPKVSGHEFNQDATTTNSMNGFKTSTSNLGSPGEQTEYMTSGWDLFVNGENGAVEELWGFKSAPSDVTSSLTASPLKEHSTSSWDPFSPLNEQAVSFPASELKDGISGLHIKADHSEKQMSSLGLVSSNKMAVNETDQSYLSESTKEAILKFYRKLQEGSLILISHHIKGHKEAPEMNIFVGQNIEDERHEEIQQAYRVLKGKNISQALNFKGRSRDECINELLNSTEEVYLSVFEREYGLSTKVLLAVESLGAALDLLKHSLFTMNALEMTSMEGINSYISTWYSLTSVCLEELKNGASIWAQAFSANLSQELLSSGENYFIALGEIYRIVEILKLTRKRFSSLLLLSNQNRLNELDMSLDICTQEWSSGLNVALEMISDGNSCCALIAKLLADSIKRISKVDIQNDELYKEKSFCRLCLLPLALLSEMKSITWHGDRYLIKLVNLWANKISPIPPKLPSVEMK